MHGGGLLADVAIILAAAFPLLFLGKRFRIPEVIAYLVTGILIGPHALAWIRELRDQAYKLLRDPAMRAAEGRRLSAALEAGSSLTFFVLPDTAAAGRTLADLGLADDHVTVPAMMRGGVPYSPAPTDAPLQAGDTLFLVGESGDLTRVMGRLEGRAG